MHRPLLGRLRGPGLPDVAVVGPMVLGRWPSWAGSGEQPKLIPLPDPDRSISRSHLAVQVSGWEVSVIDLDTENGTIVHLPTGESRELIPNVPVVIPPRTTVTLSGSVSLMYEQP